MKYSLIASALLLTACASNAPKENLPEAAGILDIIKTVNTKWQQDHPLICADSAVYTTDPDHEWTFRPYSNNSPFWDNAAYHTGNMEVCKLMPELRDQFQQYSLTWAEAAQWMGATSGDTAAWRYSYGEKPEFVLFGDWQICFQTYCDLYNYYKDQPQEQILRTAAPSQMIARARQVMEHEMSTPNNDYWWWADGLYMVMPTMTKLYRITGDPQYINKLGEYWQYSKALMYDNQSQIPDTLGQPMANEPKHLFYRDGKYLYPKHVSANGVKDFWARGCGWVVAGLAKVIADFQSEEFQNLAAQNGEAAAQFDAILADFTQTYLEMCAAVKACQQPEGYWTRSLLDPEHAPGPETSGTAFFTYGILWGINNNMLPREEYLPVVLKSWEYLTTVALQDDGTVGYVQPIGERAIPGQTVDQKSTSNFGCGAFLLAASEMYRLVSPRPRFIEAGSGWSCNSVNATVFRNSSVATLGSTQYIAYYDAEGWLTLGKRTLGSQHFQLQRSQYQGHVQDAHNVISIMPDGEGYLHVAFDHHGHPLHYACSTEPGSLQLTDMMPMVSPDMDNLVPDERDVTYPEFYRLASGNVLFAYRSGASGRGNLVMNLYDVKTRKWSRLQDVLIDGEQQRNAYWQLFVDAKGTIHVSWVWRETWMVETNHDLCYACSHDEGRTWQRSDGTKYELPINAGNAEYACEIPQQSELINQTSMSTDADGHPYIATYWRNQGDSIPQYRIVWHDGQKWNQQQVSQRRTPFSLAGGGTKMIPISRPRVAIDGYEAWYIVRDVEHQSRVSLYYTSDLRTGEWTLSDLTDYTVDAWEPSFDTELWKSQRQLHLYVQCVHQGDGETSVATPATPVRILEIR